MKLRNLKLPEVGSVTLFQAIMRVLCLGKNWKLFLCIMNCWPHNDSLELKQAVKISLVMKANRCSDYVNLIPDFMP
jgi:hypothetical protein